MFGFLKRLFGPKPSVDRETDPDAIVTEQWQADFFREDEPDKPPHVRFSITAENLYRAYLDKGALCLGLKKIGCIAWTENMFYRYQDLDVRGHFVLNPMGGYAAAGFIFRMVDDLTYYMALVSSRGYFRVDLVRNSVPLTLAGWTEAPGMGMGSGAPMEFDLELVTRGSKFLILINGLWAGSWDDSSIPEGRIAFVAASYEDNPPAMADPAGEFFALAKLVEFNLDSRIEETGKRYNNLEKTASPASRVRLAETLTALGQANPALIQLRKAWETRKSMEEELAGAEDKVVLAAIQTEDPGKTVSELLLGARLAMALELWDEAEQYIEEAFSIEESGQEPYNMKAALLYSRSHYAGLIRWAETGSMAEAVKSGAKKSSKKRSSGKSNSEEADLDYEKLDNFFADPSAFYNLLGHAYFNTGNYQKAAEVYDRSFILDEKNAIAAKNAAAAYELLRQKDTAKTQRGTSPDQGDQKDLALDRYLKAGRAFLADNHYEELGLLVPKYRLLGEANWEARALIGKWAFGIEDWKTAREELDTAEQYRKFGFTKRSGFTKKPDTPKNTKKDPPDPALYFLQALLLVREGRRQEALPLFERAVKIAPDYLLFRFRLAENRFLLDNKSDDPQFTADLEAALGIKKDEEYETYGWVHNFAAHVALSKGDVDAARSYLDNAAAVLGEVPAVRVNRAVSLYLQGQETEALAILESKPEEDPEGLMANCAGNLLVRSRRFEEADTWYRRALAIAPANALYRYNSGACLIEMERYGEADDVLTSDTGNFSSETNPDMLELIAFLAAKKGEYKRAEAASMAALKINPHHVPSLLQLGWIRTFGGRWDEVAEIIDHLNELELNKETARGRDDLKTRMRDAHYKTVSCAGCRREWQMERNPKPAASLRLYAMPPDDLPAGTCPGCANTYCVGCRKDDLDESGRFVCPDCGKPLKFTDEGLRTLLNDWAEKNVKEKRGKKEKVKPVEAAGE